MCILFRNILFTKGFSCSGLLKTVPFCGSSVIAIIVPYAVFALVFGATRVAYALGRGNNATPSWLQESLGFADILHPSKVYIEYGNAHGR